MMTISRRCYYALSIAQSVGFKVTFERQSRRVIVAVLFQPQACDSSGFSHPIKNSPSIQRTPEGKVSL